MHATINISKISTMAKLYSGLKEKFEWNLNWEHLYVEMQIILDKQTTFVWGKSFPFLKKQFVIA